MGDSIPIPSFNSIAEQTLPSVLHAFQHINKGVFDNFIHTSKTGLTLFVIHKLALLPLQTDDFQIFTQLVALSQAYIKEVRAPLTWIILHTITLILPVFPPS